MSVSGFYGAYKVDFSSSKGEIGVEQNDSQWINTVVTEYPIFLKCNLMIKCFSS